MPTSANPSVPSPSGDDRKLVKVDENYVAPNFEERLGLFWRRNSKLVTGVLLLVLLAILAKGAWEYFEGQREQDLRRSYATATTPAQVKAFAAAHPKHPLAGVANLRTADEAYGEGRFAEAIAPYEQAAAVLKTGPLASRARLGLAMSKLQSGSGDVQALKAFAADGKELKAYRAEAMYHLASLAVASGNTAELKAYSDQLMQLDPSSPWTQRSLALRSSAGAEEAAPDAVSPSISLPQVSK